MGWLVWDAGKSEGPFVMIGIKVALVRATSPYAKAGRLPAGVSSRENLNNRSKAGKQMTADFGLAGAPADGKTVGWPQVCIVKSSYSKGGASYQGRLRGLSRKIGNLSKAVLRGLGAGNSLRLPGG